MEWEIKNFKKDRFAIYEKGTNKILHNGNNYGFKSKQAAMKVAWFYYENGEKIINEAKKFWKTHKKFGDAIDYESFYRLKDGDDFDDFEEFAIELAKKYGITDFKKYYLKYR